MSTLLSVPWPFFLQMTKRLFCCPQRDALYIQLLVGVIAIYKYKLSIVSIAWHYIKFRYPFSSIKWYLSWNKMDVFNHHVALICWWIVCIIIKDAIFYKLLFYHFNSRHYTKTNFIIFDSNYWKKMTISKKWNNQFVIDFEK